MRSDLWVRAVLLASLATLLACDSGGGSKKEKPCEDGSTQSCECKDGARGKQTCSAGEYGACSCVTMDSGTDADSGAELGGLKGRVFDADTGRAVDDADLKALSGETAKSDAKGNFELKSDKDPQDVEVSKLSYAATVKRAPPKGGYMEVFIKDVDKSVDFDADKGVKVVLDSGASIEIPPGAVKDAEGKRVTGMVKLTVSDVDGHDRKQAAALPELKGERGADKGRVSVHRALNIQIVDKDGKSLTVGKDEKVVAEFPAKDVGAAQRSGLSYDEQKGVWVEEGKAKRTVNDKGEPVYRKDVDHLSWHGYGDLFATVTCLRVCVRDGDAKPVAGAQVWLVGASFPGVSSLFSGDDGCVSGDAPAAQDVVLIGQTEAGVSKALTYKTSAIAQTVDADPTACDAGAAALVIGDATPSSCPAGFNECDGVCSDPATDEANCGACGTVCGGAAGRAQVCSSGTCGCPAGTTACGEECVDTLNDPLHCGGCGMNVNANLGPDGSPQQCVDGKPAALICESRERFCGTDCVNLFTNDANCNQCGTVCAAGAICVSATCIDLSDPMLCTNAAASPCDDGLFCNGQESCSPETNGVDYRGCSSSGSPCAVGTTCDETTDTCAVVPACVATDFVIESKRCGAGLADVCLASAINSDPGYQLFNTLACGANDMTPPADPNVRDELGEPYDCESCIRNDLMTCARNTSCEPQMTALDCCRQRNRCGNQTCIQELCLTEFNALDTCLAAQPSDSGCYSAILSSTCL